MDNVGAVISKMFLDTLVTNGVIDDDDYRYVPEIVYKFGGFSKENPRCDIKIEGIEDGNDIFGSVRPSRD